ncbi:MAG: DUF1667 domain-containing protein [Candidatus Omnitrophota bacterium]
MNRKITCIDCPKGCTLSVEIEQGAVSEVSGNECPKGRDYAVTEIERPVRILTSTVMTQGLSLKMLPVKTDRHIPKGALFDAMREIKKIKVSKPLNTGDVIVENFLGLGVNLIATRNNRDTPCNSFFSSEL